MNIYKKLQNSSSTSSSSLIFSPSSSSLFFYLSFSPRPSSFPSFPVSSRGTFFLYFNLDFNYFYLNLIEEKESFKSFNANRIFKCEMKFF